MGLWCRQVQIIEGVVALDGKPIKASEPKACDYTIVVKSDEHRLSTKCCGKNLLEVVGIQMRK